MTQNAFPILISWSGGKDSALAFCEIMKKSAGPFELFTTINLVNGRVAMHGTSERLLDLQAKSIGLPLHKIYIPDPCTNEEYSGIMEEFLLKQKERGVQTIVFGDLFLEDIRQYRVENLAKLNIQPIFPLWGIPTANIALEFMRNGFKAVLSCVDTSALSSGFSGREYNLQLLSELPVNVDPCGENGEFHTFVYDGPMFSFPIICERGEQILRYDRFCYTDLLPA